MKIVSATVEYSRTVKPADYESKGAKVSLSIVPQDEDSFLTRGDLDFAGEMAQAKALELVGLKAATKPATVETTTAEKDAAKQAYADKEAAKKTVGRPKKTTPPPAEDDLPLDADTATTAPATPSADPLADELEGLGGDAEPEEVTYTADDLTKAVHQRVKALRDAGDETAPKKVGALLEKFNKAKAKQFSQVCAAIVEAGDAKQFLEKLAALS